MENVPDLGEGSGSHTLWDRAKLFTVRPMVAADVEEVAAIESENPSPWSVDSLARELEVPWSMQAVAVTQAPVVQIIGWYGCRVVCPEGELLKIAVRKKNRACGIGHVLFDHLCRELTKRNVTTLFLEVRAGNCAALRFYEKHGFQPIATRPGYYNDPPDAAVVLMKTLSSDAR